MTRSVERASREDLSADMITNFNSFLDRQIGLILFNYGIHTPFFNRLALFLLVINATSKLGKHMSLLIVTEDTNIIAKIIKRLDAHVLSYLESWQTLNRKVHSNLVDDGHYQQKEAGAFDLYPVIYFESLELLKPSELKSLFGAENCSVVACVSIQRSKKLSDFVGKFDFIIDDQSEHLSASSNFLLQSNEFNFREYSFPKLRSASQPFPRECENILTSYFIASRCVIGEENETSQWPVYHPGRHLTIGLHLSDAFRALRGSETCCEYDCYLSILLQELNLETRFDTSVYHRTTTDHRTYQVYLMPSPCPSIVDASDNADDMRDLVNGLKTQFNL